MPHAFRHVALFGRPRTEPARAGANDVLRDTLVQIVGLIEARGLTALVEATTRDGSGLTDVPGHSLAAIGKAADVALVLGGDGTFLGVARELAPYRIPLIGINLGRLGFVTDIALDQVDEVLPEMLAGRVETDQRAQLDAEILRAGQQVFHARALNDVVVSRGVAGGMVEFTVRVDGVTMANQRGDGVILATPTGSTAYALSANGPILHPSLRGLVLVPVAPQTLSNRPIVLPDDVVVEVEITDVRDASAHFDMQSFTSLQPGDIVRARRSADVVTVLHPVGYNYYATLRQKLHWNVMPSEPHGRV
jgi:NAD+ kinase